MKQFISIFILSAFLFSCISGSNKNPEMGNITELPSLKHLEGIYLNKPQNGLVDLSGVLFGTSNGLVEYIKVTYLNESKILAQGMDVKNNVIVEKEFTKGIDFDFQNGEIKLSSDTSIDGGGTQSLAVGVVNTNRSFAFNSSGDALLKTNERGPVLVLMMVPMAINSTNYIQFKRVQ